MRTSKLNILYIEPFYSGSHKQWIDSYEKYSNHNIQILSLPGKKWKWRMHGAAITLAYEFNKLNKKFDLIICSDMLNLPVFKSLCSKNINDIRMITYFHENQLSYPWSPNDDDLELKRDLHYHFINYTSSLISDYNFFNSNYQLDSYIKGLKKYLKKMPDFRNEDTIDEIFDKSSVLNIGCRLKNKINNNKSYNSTPVILWNHRWEYDKNPDLFFETLISIKKEEIKFSLVVLGEKNKEYPKIFDVVKEKLKDNILHFGYCDSLSEYLKWMNKSDIIPVTSIQDFFGISIVEAVANKNIPILPNRLSYPEIFDYKNNSNLFYEKESDFKKKLKKVIRDYKGYNKQIDNLSSDLIEKYDWEHIVNKYDQTFEEII